MTTFTNGPERLPHRRATTEEQEVRVSCRTGAAVPGGAVARAAEAKDTPADLVNVAAEVLVRDRCGLPAFGPLDRLARRVRALERQRRFGTAAARLTDVDARRLDGLLRRGWWCWPTRSSSWPMARSPTGGCPGRAPAARST